ncbi:hypothetical protein HDU93_007039 [Gonapodya sp. JEL0774]|nr:hypothetical protein HDU93_007039 [Gonapodya sp. JEL0774]
MSLRKSGATGASGGMSSRANASKTGKGEDSEKPARSRRAKGKNDDDSGGLNSSSRSITPSSRRRESKSSKGEAEGPSTVTQNFGTEHGLSVVWTRSSPVKAKIRMSTGSNDSGGGDNSPLNFSSVSKINENDELKVMLPSRTSIESAQSQIFDASFFAGYEDETDQEEEEFEDVIPPHNSQVRFASSPSPADAEMQLNNESDGEEFEDVPFPEPVDMPIEPEVSEMVAPGSLHGQVVRTLSSSSTPLAPVTFTIAKPIKAPATKAKPRLTKSQRLELELVHCAETICLVAAVSLREKLWSSEESQALILSYLPDIIAVPLLRHCAWIRYLTEPRNTSKSTPSISPQTKIRRRRSRSPSTSPSPPPEVSDQLAPSPLSPAQLINQTGRLATWVSGWLRTRPSRVGQLPDISTLSGFTTFLANPWNPARQMEWDAQCLRTAVFVAAANSVGLRCRVVGGLCPGVRTATTDETQSHGVSTHHHSTNSPTKGGSSSPIMSSIIASPPDDLHPFHVWAECLLDPGPGAPANSPNGEMPTPRWTCVDTRTGKAGDLKTFLERGKIVKGKWGGWSYAVGVENGTLRDLTPRYVPLHSSPHPTPSDPSFFPSLCSLLPPLTDPTSEADAAQLARNGSAMPTRMDDFRRHPIYALERHLKQREIIYPRTPVLGHVRGEKVFPRTNVKTLRSKEGWWKEGRELADGEQPVKWMKRRVVTLRGRREVQAETMSYDSDLSRRSSSETGKMESRHDEDGDGEGEYDVSKGDEVNAPEPGLIGLYGEWQTIEYVPPPVIDGVVPRNSFGNIDLYKPSMLPHGAQHIKVPGIAKIAKKLGVDYADAVVGFEFQSGSSHPVLDGIVVAREHVELLLVASSELAAHAAQVEWDKKGRRALSNWKKLIRGLAIRERLKREWGWDEDESDTLPQNAGSVSEGATLLKTLAAQGMEEAETELEYLVRQRQELDGTDDWDTELTEELGRSNRRRTRKGGDRHKEISEEEADMIITTDTVRGGDLTDQDDPIVFRPSVQGRTSTSLASSVSKRKRRVGIIEDSDEDEIDTSTQKKLRNEDQTQIFDDNVDGSHGNSSKTSFGRDVEEMLELPQSEGMGGGFLIE